MTDYSSIDSFHITWWPWKPVQLDRHLDWLHFDTYWSLNNCTCSCIVHWHDFFRSRGIKMESVKVAIQLHWFPWTPQYVKLVYIQKCKKWKKNTFAPHCALRLLKCTDMFMAVQEKHISIAWISGPLQNLPVHLMAYPWIRTRWMWTLCVHPVSLLL